MASTSTAQIAATAQGFSDRVASVGRQLGQRVVGFFGDTFLHIARIDVNQTVYGSQIIHVNVDEEIFAL